MGRLARVTVLFVVLGAACAAPGEKNSEDFEFVEERTPSTPPGGSTGTRTWLLDPNNALCGLLRCGNREVCLLQDRFTAVCVDKAEVARSGDRVVPLQKKSSAPPSTGNLPLNDRPSQDFSPSSSSSSSSSNRDSNAFKGGPSYNGFEDEGYGSFDQGFDEGDDDLDDDDEEDDEDYYDDEDEEEEEDDGEDSEGDEEKEMGPEKEENVTEGSSMATTPSASLSPQLDRQPFASKQCGGCPLTRPVFLCGSDNRTYSSMCRLQFHNCIHQARVEVACKGFCPCKEPGRRGSRRSKNSLMMKLRSTQRQQQQQQGRSGSSKGGKYGSTRPSEDGSSTRRPGKFTGDKKLNFNKVFRNKGRNPNKRRNEVVQAPSNNVWGPNECSQDALAAMGNRMLDWFSVIMSDTRTSRQPQPSTRAPSWCKREVSWMLGHLDGDGSGLLETRELFQLEHDDRERCIKPFLDRCDLDRDGRLAAREWCKCFDKSERPCAALRTASQGLLGGYIPECDSEGWYRPVQCHGLCWCVDRHGVELPNTRTHVKPRCDAVTQTRDMSSSRNGSDDDEDDDIDEETVLEGSADMPLDI